MFWGIAGAIILRALILILGSAMVSVAKPLMLIFAALLVYSCYGMLRVAGAEEEEEDLSANRVVRCVRWLQLPVTCDYRGVLLPEIELRTLGT